MKHELIKRILIVGHGSIGERHARLARQLIPNADIRILRHIYTDHIPTFSNGCFFSMEDAVSFAPQIAVIANPSSFHMSVAQVLADSGAHLLIEKPLASSQIGVEKLLNSCNKQGLVLLVGYNLRYAPSLRHYRNLLGSGCIGSILSVRCEVGQYLPTWRADKDYRKTVSARRDLGGGVLLELSHELDYLRWIFGEVRWVKAMLAQQSTLDIDVEDSAYLIMGFQLPFDGNEIIGSVNMDFIRHDRVRLCTAIGEKGSLRWNGLTGEILFFEKGSNKWITIFSGENEIDNSYYAEWVHFIACTMKEETPLVTGEDGFQVLKIIDLARKSFLENHK